MPVVEYDLVTAADLVETKCTMCGKWMKDYIHFMHPECRQKFFTDMIVGEKMGWDPGGATVHKYPKKIEPFSKWMDKYIKENPQTVEELKHTLPEDAIILKGDTGEPGKGEKWNYLDFKPSAEPEEELLNGIRFRKMKPTKAEVVRAEKAEQRDKEKLMKLIDKK